MTDNEIIKALECCSQTHNCQECVLWEMRSAQCINDLLSNALSLIKSQKAEIERLKAEADMADGYADALEERAKSEAVKEFAELVTADYPEMEYYLNVLVKEMTEDEGK